MQGQENFSKTSNHVCSSTNEYAYIKSYMFVKGFAVAKNLRQTLIALSIAPLSNIAATIPSDLRFLLPKVIANFILS